MRQDHGRRFSAKSLVCLVGIGIVSLGALACDCEAQMPAADSSPLIRSGIWISKEEVRALPMSGPAWEALVSYARLPAPEPDLSNQDDPSNVRVLAKALYFARTGEIEYAREVARACVRIRGTEADADALAISRELIGYILAADLVGLEPEPRAEFERWLRIIRGRSFHGRTIRSTHEYRPNNWGTHAGATRLAIAAYLGDIREIERAAYVFRGWTGDDRAWKQFEFGRSWWQAERFRDFAINPRGALYKGHAIGGVLPDDQRRAGRFRWPPPKENYVYEALQGAVSQAVLLERMGYPAWEWGDRALLRAFEWLHEQANFPAEGDDTWIPHLVNRAYGTHFPAPSPTIPGKGMGFSDWTHPAMRATP